MKIKNSLLIEKINQAITSYNEETEKEQIYLITNEKILDEDLKKIRFFDISINDVPIKERDNFFQELGLVLEKILPKLYNFYLNKR